MDEWGLIGMYVCERGDDYLFFWRGFCVGWLAGWLAGWGLKHLGGWDWRYMYNVHVNMLIYTPMIMSMEHGMDRLCYGGVIEIETRALFKALNKLS